MSGSGAAPGAMSGGVARRGLLWTAALAGVALFIVAASVIAAPGAAGAFGAALGLMLLAIAVIDARQFRIPDELNLAAFALALAAAAAASPPLWPQGAEEVGAALLRGGVLALSFLGLRALYARLRGREGLGLGDVKLAAVAGAWLDWPMIPAAVEIAALSGLGAFALLRIANRRPLAAATAVPFGLFFAPAIWICWLIQTRMAG